MYISSYNSKMIDVCGKNYNICINVGFMLHVFMCKVYIISVESGSDIDPKKLNIEDKIHVHVRTRTHTTSRYKESMLT